MFGLQHLTSACRTLAESLLALAQTVNDVNQGVRQRLALDSPDDHQALPEGTDNDPAALPAPRRNGRAKAST